jgi:nitrogen fixation NifU-like protein
MYSRELLDHFKNPRNVGELPAPAVSGGVTNPACGDFMRLYVLFEGDRVVDSRYQTRGCTASIGAGSALTEWLRGRAVEELRGLRAEDIAAMLGGLSPESHHAAVLCVEALRAVLAAASAGRQPARPVVRPTD